MKDFYDTLSTNLFATHNINYTYMTFANSAICVRIGVIILTFQFAVLYTSFVMSETYNKFRKPNTKLNIFWLDFACLNICSKDWKMIIISFCTWWSKCPVEKWTYQQKNFPQIFLLIFTKTTQFCSRERNNHRISCSDLVALFPVQCGV